MRLKKAGAMKVFTDVKSGKSVDRPDLAELLAYVPSEDILAIVHLDRLGRSLTELISTIIIQKSAALSRSAPRKNRHFISRRLNSSFMFSAP
jgi:DNA invertase Pin-like site-specific DNA recombinase